MPGTIQPPASEAGIGYSTSQVRFGRRAAALEGEQASTGRFAYWLVMLFFIQLYSSLSLLFPVVDIIRPALTIGGLALLALLMEKVSTGQAIELMWPETYLLFAFVGVAGLSVFGAFWQGYAVQATGDLIKMAIVYVLIVNTVNSGERFRGLLWVMFLCGLFPALGTIYYWRTNVIVAGRAAWLGIFGNPNELAYALAVLFPIGFFLAEGLPLLRRLSVYAILLIFTAASYVTYSRGSLIGLVVVLACMAFRQKSKVVRFIMVAVLAAGVVAAPLYWSRNAGFEDLSQDASFQQRLDTYKTALRMYADHPVLGVGINCSAVAWPFYSPKNLGYNTWLVTHNTILQAASETGTVGLVVYLLFLGAILRRAWKTSRNPRAGEEDTGRLVGALEVSFWGFLVCGLSGGYIMTWFPYLLGALISAGGKIAGQPAE